MGRIFGLGVVLSVFLNSWIMRPQSFLQYLGVIVVTVTLWGGIWFFTMLTDSAYLEQNPKWWKTSAWLWGTLATAGLAATEARLFFAG